MKSGCALLALATFVLAVGSNYFEAKPAYDKGLFMVHAGRSTEESTVKAPSDGSENPLQSGQLSVVQALDASVLAVMNDQTMTNEMKFSFFWSGYQKNKSSVALSTYFIDCLSSIVPLPHGGLLLTELDSTMTAAEIKNHLMQVLQSAYLVENGMSEDNRQRILGTIKSNIQHVDPKVAGEAVLLYARMGAQDDLIALLRNALQRQIISPLDYIREGVFQLPNVSEPKLQNALVETLIQAAQKSGSEESDHTLMASLGLIIQSPSRLSRIDPVSKNLIIQYLSGHEPVVRSDGINFDLVSVIDYGNWLNSYAVVNSKSDAEVLNWITRAVTDVNADPNKIVAVMTSPMAHDVVRLAHAAGQLDRMKHSVESEMAGQRPGTAAYSVALSLLRAGGGSEIQPFYP